VPSFNKGYAEIYDLLYQTKDYTYECNLMEEIINTYKPDAKTIMDYGCGTGNHAGLMARKGYTIYGIDRNEHMLNIAKKKLAGNTNIHLYAADKRDEISPCSIDVAILLFDVLSYMNTNEEVNDFLRFVKKVLVGGGLFIFDFWHGPGVINLKPEKRWKEYDFGANKILRLTSPAHDISNCAVNITHEIILIENEKVIERFTDIHRMRYFFKNEIQLFLDYHGFEILKFGTWNNIDNPATEKDWSALVVSTNRDAG
jgi:SAM-dependent methyltransferase